VPPGRIEVENPGQRISAALLSIQGGPMDVKQAVVIGFLVGIVLFVILERTGVIYKWFEKWDK
jgi:hypothetical protein